MTSLARSRLANVLSGGFWGAFIATLIKGALLGLDQTDAGWSWLSVPIGIVSGPALIFPDLLMLSGGRLESLVVLPWAIVGLVAGAAFGFLQKRAPADHQ